MAILYDIEHITTYKYANPVTFSEHRAIRCLYKIIMGLIFVPTRE